MLLSAPACGARYFYEPLQYFDEEQRRVVIDIVHEKVKLILSGPPVPRDTSQKSPKKAEPADDGGKSAEDAKKLRSKATGGTRSGA